MSADDGPTPGPVGGAGITLIQLAGLFVAAAVLVGSGAGRSAAAILFSDNFDGEVQGLNVTPSNFTIVNGGTVDIVSFLGSVEINLDGSSGLSGELRTNAGLLNLAAGNYRLTFDLAGNQRGGNDSVLVTVGTDADPDAFGSATYARSSADPLIPETIDFTVSAAADVRITFLNAGGDTIGALLDNVQVSDFGPAAVPEPASVALLAVGGAGLLARRRLRG